MSRAQRKGEEHERASAKTDHETLFAMLQKEAQKEAESRYANCAWLKRMKAKVRRERVQPSANDTEEAGACRARAPSQG